MHIASVSEAKAQLSALIQQALAGQDVVIARYDQPLVELTPLQDIPTPRVGGQWAGKVQISKDFEFTASEIYEMLGSPLIPWDS